MLKASLVLRRASSASRVDRLNARESVASSTEMPG
jgi:hypothetical protein